MCNLEIDLSKRHAPVFRVPEEMKSDLDTADGSKEDAALLRKLAYEGAEELYDTITPELRERIDYELEVITSKGFASYFLIVWDCVNYARKNGIPVGARGSARSSVISYCLHISAPDPIRYGLYFERFIDPDRDEMPDIDLDICQNGRADNLPRRRAAYVFDDVTFRIRQWIGFSDGHRSWTPNSKGTTSIARPIATHPSYVKVSSHIRFTSRKLPNPRVYSRD